jgi:hypothetical protein
MKTKLATFFLSMLLIFFSSCDDVNDPDEVGAEGNILVSTILPNPDGMSGSAYIQLIDNLDSKALTNAAAIPIPYSSVPCISGDNVFVLPGWGGESDIMTKYTKVGVELVKQGEYTLDAQSGATNIVTKGDLAYVACALLGKVLVINHKEMELVAEIDISSYGVGDQNPDPSSMLIRDNLLFVPLTQMVGGYYPAPERPYSDVLIINTGTNEVVKMITESTSGISTPTRPVDPYTIFMTENNDIYIVCLGAWGALPGHNSGILRIKAGETEFDDSYKFVFNTTSINGEENMLDYVHAVKYAGNNKLYGTANIPAYYGSPINFITDRTVIPVEIDLEARTIKKLDFSYSNSYGVAVGLYEDNVVFGLATTSSNGFYTYNVATGAASSSATVTTEGYPYSFVAFE